MIRIRIYKLSQIIYLFAVLLLVITVLFLSYRLLIHKPVGLRDIVGGADQSTIIDAEPNHYEDMLKTGYPILSGTNSGKKTNFFSRLWAWIEGNSLGNPKTIMMHQMPFLNAVQAAAGINEQEDLEQELGQAMEVSRGLESRDAENTNPDKDQIEEEDDIFLTHEPEIDDDILIQIAQIKDDLKAIDLTDEGPQILIYHSHSREAYWQDPKDPYKEAATEAYRSNDLTHTVVEVGRILANELNKRGIPTLHDDTNHEGNNFNSSYSRSLETIQKRMKEYDSLKIFIDLHRNGYDPAYKSANDEVVVINGQRVAKIMAVIGTGEGRFGGFSEKPKWQENYKLALKLTNTLNELHYGLAKDVYIRELRLNQHVSTQAILLEVGSNLTTLAEAKRAMPYLAEAISQIVNK